MKRLPALLLLLVCQMAAQTCPASMSCPYHALYGQLNTADCTSTQACYTSFPNPPGSTYLGLGDVPDFSKFLGDQSTGSIIPFLAGQLTAANASTGISLLNTAQSMPAILNQLQLWQAEGAQAISVEVSFPMLYQPYLDGIQPGLYNQFYTFYQNIASLIRAHNMKVISEEQVLLTGGISGAGVGLLSGNWPNLSNFYTSCATTCSPGGVTYQSARATAAANVAMAMQPDYMILQEEPDTESSQTSIASIYTQNGSALMCQASVMAVRALGLTNPTPLLGCGFGTWLAGTNAFSSVSGLKGWAEGFTNQNCMNVTCVSPQIDFLDLHVYPIGEQTVSCSPGTTAAAGTSCDPSSAAFWANLTNVVAVAAGGSCYSTISGCPVTVSQTWLRKVTNAEWEQAYAGSMYTSCPLVGGVHTCSIGNLEEAREAFEFFKPLDKLFMEAMYAFAMYANCYFVAPFNTQNLTSYIPWTTGTTGNNIYPDGDLTCTQPCGNYQPSVIFSLEQSQAAANLQTATFTDVATTIYTTWNDSTDMTPPSVPQAVTALQTDALVVDVSISWSPSTDNVGVSYYNVKQVDGGGQTFKQLNSPYFDTSLAGTTQYQVQAVDMAGNKSDWSAIATVQQPSAAQRGQGMVKGNAVLK